MIEACPRLGDAPQSLPWALKAKVANFDHSFCSQQAPYKPSALGPRPSRVDGGRRGAGHPSSGGVTGSSGRRYCREPPRLRKVPLRLRRLQALSQPDLQGAGVAQPGARGGRRGA